MILHQPDDLKIRSGGGLHKRRELMSPASGKIIDCWIGFQKRPNKFKLLKSIGCQSGQLCRFFIFLGTFLDLLPSDIIRAN